VGAGEPVPLDLAAPGGPFADADAAGDAVVAADGAPLPAPLPLDARIEERVRLRVQGRDIELTLDRVEGMRAARPAVGPARPVAADAAPNAPGARDAAGDGDVVLPPVPAPLRFVRHRLGRGPAGPADLRALLYTLAAEQERQATLPELYQHNLTTGELERVKLDSKRRDRLRDDLTRTLAGVERGEYPAKPEPSLCQGCPFLLICPG
jgi:hypothetical protein